jgi:hypothetical protein
MITAALIVFFGLVSVQAQQPPDGQNNNPPPASNPAAADNPNQQPPPQPMPEAQQQPQASPPLLTPLPPSLSPGGPLNIKKLQQAAAKRVKSPFMIPNELYLKLLKKKGDNQAEVVDLSIEPRRRWALKYYKVVAVIWSVKNPKAMIYDKDGKMHLFKEKDYIANQEGFITEINNGEVVVLERGAEHRLKMSK